MTVDPELDKRLYDAVKFQAKLEPDMYFVSREGTKVPAHRSVISLFSPLLKSAIDSCPEYLTACVVLPNSSHESIIGLVALFYSGLLPTIPENQEALKEMEETGALVGFTFDLDSLLNIESNDENSAVMVDDLKSPPVTHNESERQTAEKCSIAYDKKEYKGNKCQLCDFKNPLPINLLKHFTTVHYEQNISELIAEFFEGPSQAGVYGPCKVCNRILSPKKEAISTLRSITIHIGVFHMKVLEILKLNHISIPSLQELVPKTVDEQIKTSKKNTLSCTFKCDDVFSDQSSLRSHYILKHYQEHLVQKFGAYESQCTICYAWFNNKEELAFHIGDFHSKVKDLPNIGHDKSSMVLSPSNQKLSNENKLDHKLVSKMVERSKALMRERIDNAASSTSLVSISM